MTVVFKFGSLVAATSWDPQGLCRLVQGLLYLYISLSEIEIFKNGTMARLRDNILRNEGSFVCSSHVVFCSSQSPDPLRHSSARLLTQYCGFCAGNLKIPEVKVPINLQLVFRLRISYQHLDSTCLQGRVCSYGQDKNYFLCQ